MPLSIQVPDGTVVLSNRFGDGPIDDCQQFIQVRLPQGVEIEGVYSAPHKAWPARYSLYAFALWRGQRSLTVCTQWAPTEKGAMAMLASLARTVRA